MTTNEVVQKKLPDIIQKWLAALRSGDFRQTRGVLRDKDGYCCLGVLCTVAKLPVTEPTASNHNFVFTFPDGSVGSACLPYESELARTVENQGRLSLSVLMSKNDDGVSFSAIADYIEDHWKEA